jgi:hypothetical protein
LGCAVSLVALAFLVLAPDAGAVAARLGVDLMSADLTEQIFQVWRRLWTEAVGEGVNVAQDDGSGKPGL